MSHIDPVRLLADLVRLPSVNPMGKIVPCEPPYYELRVTDYLSAWLQDRGIRQERIPVHPGRDNLIAVLPSTSSGRRPLLVLEVHQDTVPVDGMTIEPFGARIEGGKLFGRGACDVKGGMSAMLAAFSRLQQAPHRPCDIAIAFTINEEFGFTGATKLVETWSSGKSKILPRQPDAIVVAEPTKLDVVVAHKGVVRWRCNALGKAGHSSQPHLAENAIYTMARAIVGFEQVAKSLSKSEAHPLLGAPSLSVGTIAGGVSVNTVPDLCTIEIDRRLLPGESPASAYQSAISTVAAGMLTTDRLQHAEPFIISKGLSSARNGALAAQLGAMANQHGALGNPIGVPFGTDASPFDVAGAPAVVFGPGDIAQAHTADEWIELAQLEQAAKILYDFCLAFEPPVILATN